MFAKLKWLFPLIVITVFFISGPAFNVDAQSNPFTSAFENPACQTWCWLGIEPGVTTRTEVPVILDANSLVYDTIQNPFDDLVAYTIYWDENPSIKFPFADPEANTVVQTNTDHVVSSVETTTAGLTTSQALSYINQKPDAVVIPTDPSVFYRNIGFEINVSARDFTRVASLSLTTPSYIDIIFAGEYVSNMQPCTTPAVLCNIETATPEPPPTATPIPLEPVILTAPREEITPRASVTLRWPAQATVETYFIDVYAPGGSEIFSQQIPASACGASECTQDVAVNGAVGVYDVWTNAQRGSAYAGWTNNNDVFTVKDLAQTSLTSPTGSQPAAATYNLVFTLPFGAYFMVVDVYRPGQSVQRYTVNQPDCVQRVCTLTVPGNGAIGTWNVWMVAGWGPYFGPWKQSTFTVTQIADTAP